MTDDFQEHRQRSSRVSIVVNHQDAEGRRGRLLDVRFARHVLWCFDENGKAYSKFTPLDYFLPSTAFLVLSITFSTASFAFPAACSTLPSRRSLSLSVMAPAASLTRPFTWSALP